jgi:hypothetical protein
MLLVSGESLGGVEEERGGRGISAERLKDGYVEAEALSAGCRRGYHDITALERGSDGVGLVAIQALDATLLEGSAEGRTEPRREGRPDPGRCIDPPFSDDEVTQCVAPLLQHGIHANRPGPWRLGHSGS